MEPQKITLTLWIHKALILDRQTLSHQLWCGAGASLDEGFPC